MPLHQNLSLNRCAQCTTTELLATRSAIALGNAGTATTTATTATTAAATGTGTVFALEGVGHTLSALLEGLLVGLEKVGRLVGQGDNLGLETGELDALAEDDGVVDLVESGGELFVRDHAGDDGDNLLGLEFEHGGQRSDGEAVVVGGVGEEVGAQTLLLGLAGQHGLDQLGLGHEVPDLNRGECRGGELPVTSGKSLGSSNNTVAGVLGGTGEDLALIVVQHAAEGLGDHTAAQLGGGGGLGHQRHLKQSTAGEVNALKQLEVDVHVEGQLALAFQTLLLGRDSGVTLHDDTLGKKLLLAAAATDLTKSVLGLVDEASAEGTETDLNKGAVEEDLGADVESGDVFSQMRHEHQITGLVVLVVQSKEVDLAEHGASAGNAIAVFEQVVADRGHKALDIPRLIGSSNC